MECSIRSENSCVFNICRILLKTPKEIKKEKEREKDEGEEEETALRI